MSMIKSGFEVYVNGEKKIGVGDNELRQAIREACVKTKSGKRRKNDLGGFKFEVLRSYNSDDRSFSWELVKSKKDEIFGLWRFESEQDANNVLYEIYYNEGISILDNYIDELASV